MYWQEEKIDIINMITLLQVIIRNIILFTIISVTGILMFSDPSKVDDTSVNIRLIWGICHIIVMFIIIMITPRIYFKNKRKFSEKVNYYQRLNNINNG